MTFILPGETIEAAELNALELPAWSSFTPTPQAAGGSPALGNATYSAKYFQTGKYVCGVITFTWGSTTNGGTGIFYFPLPIAPHAGMANAMLGSIYMNDASTSARNTGIVVLDGTNQRALMVISGTAGPTFGGIVTSAAPWTWTTSDTMRLNFCYEAA